MRRKKRVGKRILSHFGVRPGLEIELDSNEVLRELDAGMSALSRVNAQKLVSPRQPL